MSAVWLVRVIATLAVVCMVWGGQGTPAGMKRDPRGHLFSKNDPHDDCPSCRDRYNLCGGQSNPCERCEDWGPEEHRACLPKRSYGSRSKRAKNQPGSSTSSTTPLVTPSPALAGAYGGQMTSPEVSSPLLSGPGVGEVPLSASQLTPVADPEQALRKATVTKRQLRRQAQKLRLQLLAKSKRQLTHGSDRAEPDRETGPGMSGDDRELDRVTGSVTGDWVLGQPDRVSSQTCPDWIDACIGPSVPVETDSPVNDRPGLSGTTHGPSQSASTRQTGTGSGQATTTHQLPVSQPATVSTGWSFADVLQGFHLLGTRPGDVVIPGSTQAPAAQTATTGVSASQPARTGRPQTQATVQPSRGANHGGARPKVFSPQDKPKGKSAKKKVTRQAQEAKAPCYRSPPPRSTVLPPVPEPSQGGARAGTSQSYDWYAPEGFVQDAFDTHAGSGVNLPPNPPITGRPEPGFGTTADASHPPTVDVTRPTEAAPRERRVHLGPQQTVTASGGSTSQTQSVDEDALFSRLESSMRTMLSAMLPTALAGFGLGTQGSRTGGGRGPTPTVDAQRAEPNVGDYGSTSGEEDMDTGSESNDEEETPSTTRQTVQVACEHLPSGMVRSSTYQPPIQAACTSGSAESTPVVRQRFDLSGMIRSAMETCEASLLGLYGTSDPSQSVSERCQDRWNSLQGPEPHATMRGKYFNRDRPRVPGVAPSRSAIDDQVFRPPLRTESDLEVGPPSGIRAPVAFSTLEQFETLAREILLQLSMVDAFLCAARKVVAGSDSATPTPLGSAFWREGGQALAGAVLSSMKLLANLVLVRRDYLFDSAPCLKGISKSVKDVLRTAPLGRSFLFGGLLQPVLDWVRDHPTPGPSGTGSGGKPGRSGSARKRRRNRQGGAGASSSKKPKASQPAPPRRSDPPRQAPPPQGGTGGAGPRGNRAEGRKGKKSRSFSRGGRGGQHQ